MIVKGLCFITLLFLSNAKLQAQSDCDCWTQAFANEDESYEQAFTKMEEQFIALGFLKDRSSTAYEQLIDSIISRNDYFLFGPSYHPQMLLAFEPCFSHNACSLDYYGKIRGMSQLMQSYRDISPEQTFRDFKQIFSLEDLDNPHVRHYLLVFFTAEIQNFNSGLAPRLPDPLAPSLNPPRIKPRNILRIKISPTDSIFVEGEFLKLEDLQDRVMQHLRDTSNGPQSPEIEIVDIEGLGPRRVSQQLISLNCHRSTSYRLYTEVLDEIVEAYRQVRNEWALKEFGLSYEDMLAQSEEYQAEIRIMKRWLAQRISEAELSSK